MAAAGQRGGDEGHGDLVSEALVDRGAEDNVGLVRYHLGDERRHLVDLAQRHVLVARDREDDALGLPRWAQWWAVAVRIAAENMHVHMW